MCDPSLSLRLVKYKISPGDQLGFLSTRETESAWLHGGRCDLNLALNCRQAPGKIPLYPPDRGRDTVPSRLYT